MKPITSGFDNLPETLVGTDLGAIKDAKVKELAADTIMRQTRAIYSSLTGRGHKEPRKGPETITRDELLLHLRMVASELIVAEVKRNPDNAYEGLSYLQISRLLFKVNAGVFEGLPYAPNAVTEEDVTAACS